MTHRRGLILTGLYVPGDRADRYEKAAASGADLVVIDLEDAVAPDRKAFARESAVAWLSRRDPDAGPVLQIRVNAGDIDDLEAVAALPREIEVRVPKVEGPADLDRVAQSTGDHPLTALIETAAGVLNSREIAAHSAVTRVALGEADLRSAVGAADDVIDFARLQLVYAASAAGIDAPMLSVHPAIDDLAGLAVDTRHGALLGFVGRMAVHPRQLPVIIDAFRPAATAVEWATEAVEAMADGGVHRMADGSMVDRAMLARAEHVLALARATADRDGHA